MQRKLLSEKTVAANVLKHGTGAMNIDGCRVSTTHDLGRWPPNILLTHSADCVPAGEKKVRNLSGSIRGDEPSAVTDAVYQERERVAWQAHGDADGIDMRIVNSAQSTFH